MSNFFFIAFNLLFVCLFISFARTSAAIFWNSDCNGIKRLERINFYSMTSLPLTFQRYAFHLDKRSKWWKKYLTWYHMQIAVTGMKIANTSHATCDMTAMVPRSWIIENAHHPSLCAISMSSTLWSVDVWEQNIQNSLVFRNFGFKIYKNMVIQSNQR